MPENGANRGRAFTLIEMLVVISIIVLLTAILLPALGQTREMSENVKCLSNQHQLGIALFSYFGDVRGQHLPMYDRLGRVFPASVLRCPSDAVPDRAPAGLFGNAEELALSYALNTEFGWHGIAYSELARPSQYAYFFDGVTGMPSGGGLAMSPSAGDVSFASSSSDEWYYDSTDTIQAGNGQGQPKIRITHIPPGNPNNGQEVNLPIPAVQGHLAHGCLIGGAWPAGVDTYAQRMQAAFVRRHLNNTVGNVLMLDGHAISTPQLEAGMLLNLDDHVHHDDGDDGNGNGNGNGNGKGKGKGKA